ncbi:MAG: hypothetical protein QXX20_04260 [Candidatus Thermoplasmatota archaeon]
MIPKIFSKTSTDYGFNPTDITLSDDGFHRSDMFHFIEWWYFDAIFENGYSAQMSIRVVNAFDLGIVYSRLDIYKHGILLSHNQESYLFDMFIASSSQPLVYLDGKKIIQGYIDEKTDTWIFDVCFSFSQASADLRFIGLTKGWKGQLPGGDWWGVILPQAAVTGSLTLHDQSIPVSGRGYHDHNWEVTASAGLNFGWFWGKISSEKYAVTWSTILSTRFIRQPILVINTQCGGYLNIPSPDIDFAACNYSFDSGLLSPHSFSLVVHTSDVDMKIDIEVLSVHHDRILAVLNYWRYHVKCTGFITLQGVTEPIDSIEIAEFLRFR